MAALLSLVIICLQVISVSSKQCADSTGWNHLSVTFTKFNTLPITEADAKEKGWTLVSDDCADPASTFHGKRYMLEGEHATILIFDVHGLIAGMQMAYKTELKKKGKYRKYAGVMQEVHEARGKFYYLTAYFTDPKKICDTKIQRAKGIIGDKLVFLAGKDKYVEAPLLSKDAAGTKWVLGRCFIGMGTHYWYDISSDMNCDDLFPAFLMYNKGKLSGWGFATDVQVTSSRVEHPSSMLIWLFFKKDSLPKCLPKLDSRSTQHVYFTKVGMFTHLCF